MSREAGSSLELIAERDGDGDRPYQKSPDSELEVGVCPVAEPLMLSSHPHTTRTDPLILVTSQRDITQRTATTTGTQRDLDVGGRKMNVDVKREGEFDWVLSHPSVETDLGTAPVGMFCVSYSAPTWIDFINHLNQEKLVGRVLQLMGHLYATKKCRAIYFEGDSDFETQAEEASRTCMWQELSVGPQAHSYNRVSATHDPLRRGDRQG